MPQQADSREALDHAAESVRAAMMSLELLEERLRREAQGDRSLQRYTKSIGRARELAGDLISKLNNYRVAND